MRLYKVQPKSLRSPSLSVVLGLLDQPARLRDRLVRQD